MKTKQERYKRLQGTTIEQQNAVDLLVQGKTDQEVADAVCVHRVTVTKWRNLDPYFQAELNGRRQDIWGCAAERLRAMLEDALDVLQRKLEAGNPRVAVQVLKLAGLEKLGQPTRETDAEAIVDDLARASWTGGATDKLLHQLSGNRVTDDEREAVLEELDRKLAEDSEPTPTLID